MSRSESGVPSKGKASIAVLGMNQGCQCGWTPMWLEISSELSLGPEHIGPGESR